MKYAVVGGGIGGLTIAYRLCQKGHNVILFEQTGQLGGQARTAEVWGKLVEVYYHHYNFGDHALFKLCKELGVKIEWFNAPMGYLSGGKIYDFNTPIDLLKFKPLPLTDKFWFVWGLYFNMGETKKVYDTIWRPLLVHKFGVYYNQVPMSWIYSRPKSGGRLAYIPGTTQELIDKLHKGILKLNGKVMLNQGYIKDEYAAVIDTTPRNNDMLPVTCVVLQLDRPLTKYYWLNIGDLSFPFGLIVQRGNLIYIPQYGKPLGDCVEHLNRINPEFNESWILESHVFKDEYVQPININTEERGLNKIIAKAEKTVLWC